MLSMKIKFHKLSVDTLSEMVKTLHYKFNCYTVFNFRKVYHHLLPEGETREEKEVRKVWKDLLSIFLRKNVVMCFDLFEYIRLSVSV